MAYNDTLPGAGVEIRIFKEGRVETGDDESGEAKCDHVWCVT
jgi:hypothetical protein